MSPRQACQWSLFWNEEKIVYILLKSPSFRNFSHQKTEKQNNPSHSPPRCPLIFFFLKKKTYEKPLFSFAMKEEKDLRKFNSWENSWNFFLHLGGREKNPTQKNPHKFLLLMPEDFHSNAFWSWEFLPLSRNLSYMLPSSHLSILASF